MGLFGKLFEKKNCSICGGEIGMLGNKKLSDGNLCKNCRKKLSEFYDGFGNATVEGIQTQLTLREENRRKLDEFQTTYAFGEHAWFLIDAENQQFVVLSESDGDVTSIDQVKDKNPDIIKFSQVRDVKIKEMMAANEVKKTVDGKQVSYNPKHMTYYATFDMQIFLKDHPYLEYIYVTLNKKIQIKCEAPRKVATYGEIIALNIIGLPEAQIDKREKAYNSNSLLDIVFRSDIQLPDYSFGFPVNFGNRKDIQRYKAFLIMSDRIKEIILGNYVEEA